ncbi:transmembrane protein 254 isoform X4 [Tachyglossus aculeatus]|nr:transmembrane protein 254 isoform X4 [Tachyglossus aculeatus]
MEKVPETTYFRRVKPLWFAVIAVSMGYFAVGAARGAGTQAHWPPRLPGAAQWAVFWPQSIPYQKLGPLGSFTQYLVDRHHTLLVNGFWLAWLVHIFESLYALVLCR